MLAVVAAFSSVVWFGAAVFVAMALRGVMRR